VRSAPYPTEWGPGWVCWDPTGIVHIDLPGAVRPAADNHTIPPEVSALCASLEAYFAGIGELPPAPGLVARAATTPMRAAVYRIVSAIVTGTTMTYTEVAAAAGRPGAARAVGAAMAANPFAPVIPCHRVVGSDGSLRGYRGGVAMKQRLLAMEGSP